MRLLHPQAAKLEQGAIFNCLRINGYENCACSGLILNARCDLEHNKQSSINYLPIISLNDWLKRDFLRLLAKRLIPELSQSLNTAFKNKNIPKSVTDIFPKEEIIAREFTQKEQLILNTKLVLLRIAESAIDGGISNSLDNARLLDANSKVSLRILEELIKQQLPEYYFLNDVDIYDQQSHGYVVLLRHISTMGCEEIQRIAQGISDDNIQEIATLSNRLTFEHDPICMMTGVLRSPDVEHLAQHFSNLYIRIGLKDQDANLPEKYLALATTIPSS
jgi:hypothetical protein